MTYDEYLPWLKEALIPLYTPPNVPAGNDRLHCDRMAEWGPKILGIAGLVQQGCLQFDMQEYVVTCWLHNIDVRVEGKLPWADAELMIRELLLGSPFGEEARERIVRAIKEHPKFKDDPSDSHLLTALRIADKVDKLQDSTMGIIGACSMRGIQVLAYDPVRPFNYTSTEEGKLKSIYNDFMRQLEWYGMLPSDEARQLVSRDSMRFYIEFVRRFGAFIAHHVGGNGGLVEDDLRRALGSHYDRIADWPLRPLW